MPTPTASSPASTEPVDLVGEAMVHCHDLASRAWADASRPKIGEFAALAPELGIAARDVQVEEYTKAVQIDGKTVVSQGLVLIFSSSHSKIDFSKREVCWASGEVRMSLLEREAAASPDPFAPGTYSPREIEWGDVSSSCCYQAGGDAYGSGGGGTGTLGALKVMISARDDAMLEGQLRRPQADGSDVPVLTFRAPFFKR